MSCEDTCRWIDGFTHNSCYGCPHLPFKDKEIIEDTTPSKKNKSDKLYSLSKLVDFMERHPKLCGIDK